MVLAVLGRRRRVGSSQREAIAFWDAILSRELTRRGWVRKRRVYRGGNINNVQYTCRKM